MDCQDTKELQLALAQQSDQNQQIDISTVIIQQHDTVVNNHVKRDVSLPVEEVNTAATNDTDTGASLIEEEKTIATEDTKIDSKTDMETDHPDKVEENIDAAIAAGTTKDDYESSDLESSSSDDSSSDEDEDEPSNDAKFVDDIDEDEDDSSNIKVVRTTHEIVDIHINRPDFEIGPVTTLIPVGKISNIIGNVIVVESIPLPNGIALDMGTLFAYSDRSVMGEVFETFGPVHKPFYSVRFNTAEEIEKDKAVVGSQVYYVPSYERTSIVPTEELKKIKGNDASNLYDEEVGEDELEFSDDEQEMLHKRMLNQKRRLNKQQRQGAQDVQGMQGGRKTKRKNTSTIQHDDFDAALMAYGAMSASNDVHQARPARQVQSYADIFTETVPATARPANDYYSPYEPMQQSQQPQQPQQHYLPGDSQNYQHEQRASKK